MSDNDQSIAQILARLNMLESMSSRVAAVEGRVEAMEDDAGEPQKRWVAEDGGSDKWSGKLLSLHGAVLWEEDADASPPTVISGKYICVDTSFKASPIVSWADTAPTTPRYIYWEVAESDGNGGYRKISGRTVGDIRVPVILGAAVWSVLTQKSSTTGIDMGYLRAIGGTVP